MTCTVTWTRRAHRRLAELWLAAPDRAELTAAANSIDAELARDPLNAGESRRGGARVIITPPLGVFFDVLPDDNHVEVWAVWRSR
jgi:hypothetical protein